MRSRLLALAVFLAPAAAYADDSSVPEDLDRLILDTGRIKLTKPEHDKLSIDIRGELQLRAQGQNPFPMDVTASQLDTHPGAISDSLGQHAFFTQWVRITPRLQYRDWLQVVA